MLAIVGHNVVTMRCVFRDDLAVRSSLIIDFFRCQEGKTALHFATNDDAYGVAKLLLDVGADLDAPDEVVVGVTPLRLAVQNQNLNVLQIFLNHHQLVATPERQDFSGAVLLLAVDYEAEEVLQFVVENEYAPVTVCNASGESLLHRAILRRSPQLMELLADLD
ncbi:hypothetical protein BBJ28_00025294, partial [Nothophytophthora sp. Chile5]